MPKALKWGIVIALCMLLLCTIYIFRNQIGGFLTNSMQSFGTELEMDDPFLESTEVAPWETEIPSAGIEDK